MTKKEIKDLKDMANRFVEMAQELEKWNEENRDMCGHSDCEGALGDEGWNELFINTGEASGLYHAALSIREYLLLSK